MERQKQNANQKSNNGEQTPDTDYRLEELLASSPRGAFSLDAQDDSWLSGPLVEKENC